MADAKILDINGSQWNFKDEEARNKVSETNDNLTALTQRVNNIIYPSQTNSCGANLVVRIPRRSTKTVDILPLLNGKVPPTNADVVIQCTGFYGSSAGTVELGTYAGDVAASIPSTHASVKYLRNSRQIQLIGNANDTGTAFVSIGYSW